MSHNFKTFGVGLIAVFALSAIAASSAFATAAEFTWETGTTKLTAEQAAGTEGLQTFTTEVGGVECNKVKGEASVSGTQAATVTTSSITYTNSTLVDECPTTVFGLAKVTMNGCNFVYHAGMSVVVGMESEGTVDIVCPAGAKIEYEFFGGKFTVGPQTGLGPVTYDVNTSITPHDVVARAHITNIAWSSSGFAVGTHSGTNGTYTGTITLKGQDAAGVLKDLGVTP